MPKNILMIGPTGCGKTEIARRLARLAGAPFLKVEATKFTEVGYVGRDVEQIVRDLVEIGISLVKQRKRKDIEAKAELAAEERMLDALVGASRLGRRRATRSAASCAPASSTTRRSTIELPQGGGGMPMFELPNMPGASVGAINLGDIFGKGFGAAHQAEAHDASSTRTSRWSSAEAEKMLDQDQVVREAIAEVESNGIVFLDEIDKICARDGPRRRRRVARGRAARPAAADRRHDGRHQARLGQDRPHPVHRLRRLPHRAAARPAARTAGPPADPRRARFADRGRFQAHPHRDRGEPDQAICGADGGRRACT